MNEPMAALEAGIVVARAETPEDARRIAAEDREVKKWQERIKTARKFDASARQQYAKDRRYARGDSGYEVDANLAGTNINILESRLYAKDPDFDVTPGPTVRPPGVESLRDAIEEQLDADPSFAQEVTNAGAQAAALAVSQQVDEAGALQVGQMAEQMKREEIIQSRVKAMHKEFARKRREVKNFAETCEIIGARMWDDAHLKRRGRPLVRSGLTIGIGILKASWQERTEPSPVTMQTINDLQDNLARLRAAKIKAAEGGFFDKAIGAIRSWVKDDEQTMLDIQDQIRALQQQPQPVVDRGYVIDNVAGEDFQIPPGFTMANHLDAPWNAHRFWILKEDAQVAYGLTDAELESCVKFRARRPQMVKNVTIINTETSPISPKEADQFINASNDDTGDWGEAPVSFEADSTTPAPENWLEGWEIWDLNANCVRIMISGLCRWAAPSWVPKPTTRFYPFFVLPISEVDGQRHPQSMITRAAKLLDEYNRIGSAEAEHRRRIIPKTAFNAGAIDKDNVAKLEKGGIQEMVGLELTDPTANVGDLLLPVTYAAIDPALYNRGPILQEINRIFGTQEALGGGINVDKTATEADIQQQGFQMRAGSIIELMDMLFSDLALYTIETARAFVSQEDAVALAGPDAFWPPYEGADDMAKMLHINIRAGSSGKPNTALERQSWAALLPQLQSGIVQIGQLRGSSPASIADAMEQLLRITAERSGERIDIDQLIPQMDESMPMQGAPQPGGPQPGAPAPEGAPTPDPAADPAIDPTQP